MAFVVFLRLFLKKPIFWLLGKLRNQDQGLLIFEEKLDTYFVSLPRFAKTWWSKEEEKCRNEIHFSILSDEAYEKL
jgi:hypothetical protein